MYSAARVFVSACAFMLHVYTNLFAYSSKHRRRRRRRRRRRCCHYYVGDFKYIVFGIGTFTMIRILVLTHQHRADAHSFAKLMDPL